MSKNVLKCYLDLKINFKTGSYEETKYSKGNSILQGAHYDGNRNFTLDNYYKLVAKAFVQLKEADNVHMLTEAHNTNSIENRLKEPTSTKCFDHGKKRAEQTTGK